MLRVLEVLEIFYSAASKYVQQICVVRSNHIPHKKQENQAYILKNICRKVT